MFSEILQRDFESITICARRDRQSAAAVQKIEGALLETHPQLAAFKDTSILVTEDGKQDLVVKIRFQRMPVDIEIGRISGAGPIFEHIHPPFIERLRDPDMVRYEIEHLAHRVRMQIRNPGVVSLPRADRRVER